MLRCKAAEVHRDSFAPSHLSTSVASRSGWLAQLVRAPVSHTGGHRFESCTAHYTSSHPPCRCSASTSGPCCRLATLCRVTQRTTQPFSRYRPCSRYRPNATKARSWAAFRGSVECRSEEHMSEL